MAKNSFLMNDRIRQIMNKAFDRLPPKPTLCLGFSGGPDSTFLLHVLLNLRTSYPCTLCLGHVDHGWRRESTHESDEIKQLALKLQLPIYVKRLEIDVNNSNLEDYCRQERLKFFHTLYRQGKFDALVLGHQRNDQAETILKRICEGARFFGMEGLRDFSFFKKMPLVRPLLHIDKIELYQWLKENGQPFFEDETNQSERFLRGRMRTSMMPLLQRSFGKNIQRNLSKLADRSTEINKYLMGNIQKFLQAIETKASGEIHIDFNPFYPLQRLELEFFIDLLLKEDELKLSHQQICTLIDLLCNRAYDKKIVTKKATFLMHGGVLKIYKTFMPGCKNQME